MLVSTQAYYTAHTQHPSTHTPHTPHTHHTHTPHSHSTLTQHTCTAHTHTAHTKQALTQQKPLCHSSSACTDGDTNAVHQSGESWRCRDGCPTWYVVCTLGSHLACALLSPLLPSPPLCSTCRHGSVVVNATGCPSNCTNGDGDIIPEGSYWQLNNDPCTTW